MTGVVSNWLELDSPDDWVRHDCEIVCMLFRPTQNPWRPSSSFLMSGAQARSRLRFLPRNEQRHSPCAARPLTSSLIRTHHPLLPRRVRSQEPRHPHLQIIPLRLIIRDGRRELGIKLQLHFFVPLLKLEESFQVVVANRRVFVE